MTIIRVDYEHYSHFYVFLHAKLMLYCICMYFGTKAFKRTEEKNNKRSTGRLTYPITKIYQVIHFVFSKVNVNKTYLKYFFFLRKKKFLRRNIFFIHIFVLVVDVWCSPCSDQPPPHLRFWLNLVSKGPAFTRSWLIM